MKTDTYDDVDWKEVEVEIEKELKKYPIIKRYVDLHDITIREEQNKMANLKDTAVAYEPKITLNVADLEKVDILSEMEDRTGTDDKGIEFNYKVLVIDGKEYRTPNTVIEEIKKILSLKPDVKFVNVTKSGSGLNTRYSVQVAE